MRPTAPGRVAKTPSLVPFAALSASYFAHIGFFNPYLPLWLKDLGLPIFTIGLLTSMQSFTRLFAPYAWARSATTPANGCACCVTARWWPCWCLWCCGGRAAQRG